MNELMNNDQHASISENNRTIENTTTSNKKYVSAPYIKGASERTAKILKPFGIILSHKSKHTLRSQLTKIKDPREKSEKIDVVYKIKCADCNHIYIGETGRELGKRISEHKNPVRRCDPLSTIYKHVQDTGHNISWDDAEVISNQQGFHQRKMMEAFHSFNKSNALNRSVTVPAPYIPLVTTIL